MEKARLSINSEHDIRCDLAILRVTACCLKKTLNIGNHIRLGINKYIQQLDEKYNI